MLTAYHLSPEHNIRRFDLAHVGSGLGTTFYGAGLYLTFNKETINYYADQILERPLTIYTVEVQEEGLYDEFDKLENGETALGTYANLVEQFGGNEIRATREIVKQGVKGIFYNSPEDGKSLIVYDPKIVKIVEKQQI